MCQTPVECIGEKLIRDIQDAVRDGVDGLVQKTIAYRDGTIPDDANGTDKRKPWYFRSYPHCLNQVVSFVRQCRQNRSDEHDEAFLAMMVAGVGAWVQSIPKATLWNTVNNRDVIDNLLSLHGISLDDVELDLDKKGRRNCVTVKKDKTKHQKADQLDRYFTSINNLLNGEERGQTRYNLPTVSKFLHFCHPDLFPVLDRNINDKVLRDSAEVYRKQSPTLAAYFVYMAAIKRLLCNKYAYGVLEEFRNGLAKERMSVGYLRAVDLILF